MCELLSFDLFGPVPGFEAVTPMAQPAALPVRREGLDIKMTIKRKHVRAQNEKQEKQGDKKRHR